MPTQAPSQAKESEISELSHVFRTTLSVEKFEAVVARSCRAAVKVELQGSDPTLVPVPRLFGVQFTSLEDRDRVRIAMRFVEKEAEAALAEPRAPAPQVRGRALASA